jgi:hypothetical protein
MTPGAPRQLLVFGFSSAEGHFEGRLGGALQRAESGGALRIGRALFVGREVSSGELAVADLHAGAGGLVASLLSFRLDPARRQRATAEALDGPASGVPPDLLRELGDVLEPGEAIIAVLVEHVWASVLADAVARSNGRALADELVPAGDVADFGHHVQAISARWRHDPAAPAGADC